MIRLREKYKSFYEGINPIMKGEFTYGKHGTE